MGKGRTYKGAKGCRYDLCSYNFKITIILIPYRRRVDKFGLITQGNQALINKNKLIECQFIG